MSNYGAAQMTSIRDHRELVRSKSSNFIPDTELEGAIHIALEIGDNCIDEALNDKKANVIKIIVDDDIKRLTFIDNGRGIPHNNRKSDDPEQRNAFFRACTEMYTGAKHKTEEGLAYNVSGGTNGVGLKLAVYLSKECTVTSERDGSLQSYEFKDGKIINFREAQSKNRGTTVSYILDEKLIDTREFNFESIKNEMKDKAFMFPSVEFHLVQIKNNHIVKSKTYKGKDLTDAVTAMKPDTPIIRVTKEKTVSVLNNKLSKTEEFDVFVDVAFAFKDELIEDRTDEYKFLPSFANGIRTTIGGSHSTGLKEGLVKFFKQQIEPKFNVIPTDITTALCGYVTVKLSSKQFRGQYKDALNSEAARLAVRDAVYEQLTKEKDVVIKKMITFIKDVAKSREASKKSRTKKAQTAFSKDTIAKYVPLLETENTFSRELYLGEGDSALGSISQARDINNHAILPMGRPTNFIDKKYGDLVGLKSSFHDMMNVVGIELGKKIKRDDLNFDKIIFALDGDIDGDGMSAANLALMRKFTPELFEWNMVYRLVPPLYKFNDKKGEVIYLTSQKEFNRYIAETYMEKNSIQLGKIKFKKKDIGRLLEDNFSYAKELDKLAKKIVGTPKFIERLLWFYNPLIEYGKKDIDFFKKVLVDYPYVDIVYKKGTINFEGTDGDDLIHITVNKFFKKSIMKFKDIQSPNITVFGFTLNGKPVSLYDVIRSLEDSMPKDIDRIKGLGELDPVEFKHQCMNHKNRTLLKMELGNNPEKELDRIYVHYSQKAQYKELRNQIMRSIVVDEDRDLDT